MSTASIGGALRQRWVNELIELLPSSESGIVVGVQVAKPRPWPPAAEMLKMQERGASVRSIARATGYSVITVRRNLATRGEDCRVGPQCDRHADRIFSIREALDEMPLPCGEDCICRWRPILRSDLNREL